MNIHESYNEFCNESFLFGNIAWTEKTYDHMRSLNLPLTTKAAKILKFPEKIICFHTTDYEWVKKFHKLVGSKKAISAFTEMAPNNLGKMISPWTDGGVLLELEADVLLQSNYDIMSAPDESGRRWVKYEFFKNRTMNLKNKWNSLAIEYKQKEKEFGVFSDDVWRIAQNGTPEEKKQLQKFISWYIEAAEKFFIDNIHELKLSLISADNGGYWDEIVVNNVQVKDILAYIPREAALDTEEFLKYVRSKFNDVREYRDTLEKLATGTVYMTPDKTDAIKFVNDRKKQ